MLGEAPVADWKASQNEYDWLGQGIYFWEHAQERAQRWAGERGIVIGAVIQLGQCLDLTDLHATEMLPDAFKRVQGLYKKSKRPLPTNHGKEFKNRKLDCLVLNHLVVSLKKKGMEVQAIRGAFEEGESAFPGSMLKKETHIQVAVRDLACILGVFRPV